MNPIYFRLTTTYLIEGFPNLEIHTKAYDSVPVGPREWVSFAARRTNVDGSIKPCLYVFMKQGDYSELINAEYDNRQNPNEERFDQLNKIADSIREEMFIKSQQVVRQFRWLTGLRFSDTIKGERFPLEWSRDEESWEKVPIDPPQPRYSIIGLYGNEPTHIIDKAFIDEHIAPYLEAERLEPLGHELLFEANRLFGSLDYRGAFLLGFSALEVGVKNFISSKIKEATWLMNESPSPDMLRICSQYLPTLDERLNIEGTLEKKLIEAFMQSRNKLAHRGQFINAKGDLTENGQTILKKLKMVEYMLYRFDDCLGVERAKLYADHAKELMETLGKVKPSDKGE